MKRKIVGRPAKPRKPLTTRTFTYTSEKRIASFCRSCGKAVVTSPPQPLPTACPSCGRYYRPQE